MHLYEQNSLPMTSIHIVFNTGAIYETPGQYGTMHFMEHLVCHNYKPLEDKLHSEGIVMNASTTHSQVIFYFKGLESRLGPLKSELVNLVLGGFKSTPEQVESERAVVIQEYMDVFEDPLTGSLHNFMRSKFESYGPVGLRSDIENFTYDDAVAAYEKWFTSPAHIIEIGPNKSSFPNVHYSDHAIPDSMVLGDYETPIETIPSGTKTTVMGIGSVKCPQKDLPALNLAIRMLNGSLNSPLYKSIREDNGLSYFSILDIFELGSFALPIFAASTDNDNAGVLLDLYKSFTADIESHLTRERFDICKKELLVLIEKRDILLYDNPDKFINIDLYTLRGVAGLSYEDAVYAAGIYLTKDVIEFNIKIYNDTRSKSEK